MPAIPAAKRPIQWTALSDDLQLALAEQALQRAAETIAGQAESLATEMETGSLSDQGGPDALRLLAAVIRATNAQPMDMKRH